jgi:hypothetical protein
MDNEPRFEDMSWEAQQAIRLQGEMLSRLAFGYVCTLLLAPSVDKAKHIFHGSATVAEIEGRYYLITAAHLLDDVRTLRESEPSFLFHLSGKATSLPFDPEPRVALYDKSRDVLFLALSETEAAIPGTVIYRPQSWPPPRPPVETLVTLVGYPVAVREQLGPNDLEFPAMTVSTPVTTSAEGRLTVLFERQHWITSTPDLAPQAPQFLGGLSGGPVFWHRSLSLELVAVISQHSEDLDYLICGALDNLRPLTVAG